MLKVFGGFVISLGLLGGWLPLSFSVALTGLEILVAFLQAYVYNINLHYLNDDKFTPLIKGGKWSWKQQK